MTRGACTVIRLDVTDLRRAVEDPALQALLADGWQVLCSVVIDDGPQGQYLHLVLRPPVSVPAPAPQVQTVPPFALAALLGAITVGQVLGALVAAALR
jgi:hypothetical protein